MNVPGEALPVTHQHDDVVCIQPSMSRSTKFFLVMISARSNPEDFQSQPARFVEMPLHAVQIWGKFVPGPLFCRMFLLTHHKSPMGDRNPKARVQWSQAAMLLFAVALYVIAIYW
jgi:hypothetical protein